MFRQTLVLLPTAITACAEPLVIPFSQPENFPLSFRLLLPRLSTVVSHEQTHTLDTIVAKIDDDRGEGMVVEAVDTTGKPVWRRDFGYNLSAAPGCSISISFHPQVSALIVSYHGYKWDLTHHLLFLHKTTTGHKIREYPSESPDILPFLKKQSGYDEEYQYWIYPSRFSGDHVIFSCIPQERPESGLPHPLAQDRRWFDITTSLSNDFKLIPITATVSH